MTTRETPWDIVFGTPASEARFEQIRDEDRGAATTPAELLMQPAAGSLLREMVGDVVGDAGDGGGRAVYGEIVAQVGALLFHAYRFWLAGLRVDGLDQDAVDALLGGAVPPADWSLRTPGDAGYVQLPRNAVWARVDPAAAAEPVDGFFWSAPGTRLDVLLALGVRAGRPGLSLVPVGVETLTGIEEWARAHARPDGTDFDNVLPGGELQGYRAVTTEAEVLKLVLLCFRHLETRAPDG